jgi:hypothetical protein
VLCCRDDLQEEQTVDMLQFAVRSVGSVGSGGSGGSGGSDGSVGLVCVLDSCAFFDTTKK